MNSDYNWREKAAAIVAASEEDIEQAFASQATNAIASKIGNDLFQEPYRIGFEIVKKNDDNTRMVGIYAFKIDGDIVYAPVFFLNGEIKGPLLYRTTTKTFLPATRESASALIENIETTEGRSIDRSKRVDNIPLVYLDRISYGRSGGIGIGKRASASKLPEIQTDKKKDEAETYPEDTLNAPTHTHTGVVQGEVPKEVTNKLTDNKPGELRVSNGVASIKIAHDGTIRVEQAGWEESNSWLSKVEYDIIHKQGSHTLEGTNITITKQDLEELEKQASGGLDLDEMLGEAVAESGQLIREFLSEPEVSEKTANTILEAAEDFHFASLLAHNYPDADFIPLQKKEASTREDEGELKIFFNETTMKKEGAWDKRYFKDGFFIQDTRPEDTMSVVYVDEEKYLEAPSTTGVYKLLNADGGYTEKTFVGKPFIGEIGNSSSFIRDNLYSTYDNADYERAIFLSIDRDNGVNVSKDLIGTMVQCPCEAEEDGSFFTNKIPKDVPFFIYAKGQDVVVGPFKHWKTKYIDNVGYHTVRGRTTYRGSWNYEHNDLHEYVTDPDEGTFTFIHNKDNPTCEIENSLLGDDVLFIKCPFTKREQNGVVTYDITQNTLLGTAGSINQWLEDKWGVRSINLSKKVWEDETIYYFKEKDKQSPDLVKVEAMLKLAHEMELPVSRAYEIIDMLDEKDSVNLDFIPNTKSASRLEVIDRPTFDLDYDSNLAVQVQPEQVFKLRVRGDSIQEPPPSVGDAWNPTSANGLPTAAVLSNSPEDLKALAQMYNLPHVFEHGIVGNLADAYDSLRLVETYLPAIEEGVDKLGRIKFLLHWDPEAFEKAYGVDDMINFESEINSEFEGLGSLFIKLLKRTSRSKKGEGNFTETN